MRYFLILLNLLFSVTLFSQITYISGKVIDAETQAPLANVTITCKDCISTIFSDKTGRFFISNPTNTNPVLSFYRIGYKTLIKNIVQKQDTLQLTIFLTPLKYDLPIISIVASNQPDTVFGTWRFSVADFEFHEDKLLLLTYEKSLKKAKIMLVNNLQKVLSSFEIPDIAQYLFKDYMGHINIICDNHIYRIKIKEDIIQLASLPVDAFNERIRPCVDSFSKNIYFSDYSKDYPEFTYYAYSPSDDKVLPIKKITDHEQLKEYNMEYYFLKPKERLIARKLADEYNVDKHKIAATMSGVTRSMFYTPLYAPLHILNDTILIFNHYSNAIIKFTKDYVCVDSIPINYHHPVKWREWKHKLYVDKEKSKAYALYQKDGCFYLKNINTQTGKIMGSYKLSNKFVDKIKIKDGYVYYVYHPFESLQQSFLYRERIQLE